jgi:nitroreductase
MEVIEAIKTRRSIRKFQPDSIPENYINELIEAGRLAPSGTNIQPTRYVVMKSAEVREKLKNCTPLPFVAAAPIVIACCIDNQSIMSTGDRIRELQEAQAFVDTPLDNNKNSSKDYTKGSSMDDKAIKAYLNLNAAIAIEHITLRAVELGLGSCWVMMFDKEKVRNLLGLDERYDIVALLPIGYPDQSPAPRPRLDIAELLLKEI